MTRLSIIASVRDGCRVLSTGRCARAGREELSAEAGALHRAVSPPGGGVDIVARAVADKLGDILGQQVIVDNRGGGGTIIGTELGARAAPDGYTLLFGSTTLAINPSLRSKLPYDTLKDLVPVTQASFQAYVLVVHPGVPAKNVKEFIALAKAKPDALTYGSPGIGSGSHLVAEFFALSRPGRRPCTCRTKARAPRWPISSAARSSSPTAPSSPCRRTCARARSARSR